MCQQCMNNKDAMASKPETPSQCNAIHQNKKEIIHEDNNISCGLGKFRPKWFQIFASKKTYVIVYGILGMNQTAIGTYFIGTISTIEKRFKLPSRTFGFITSSWDIGVICTVLFIGYIGSTVHKTRSVAISAIFAALSCYLRYLPHILYGTNSNVNFNSKLSRFDLCTTTSIKDENCTLNSEGLISTIIFTIAHIAFGIGTATYNTLGAAYLDDNSAKDKAPFLISLVTCFRHLGPTIGFMLASYVLEMNETPNLSTHFGHNDQRYVGAWHWGWVPLGTVHLVLALMMAFFPKILPREAQRRKINPVLENNVKRKWCLTDLKTKITKLLQNHLLLFNVCSSTFYMFGSIGYRVFLPKYIESQFMQSASRANFATGTIGIICSLLGILLSGSYISKFKPHPRSLAAWSFFTKTLEIIVYITLAFISCEKGQFYGMTQDSRSSLVSKCNMLCACESRKYSPVCDVDARVTFFSPCQAGCKSTNSLNGTTLFGDCSCILGKGVAKEGMCSTNCEENFITFLVFICFLKFISATGKAGSTIIQYRSVDPEDKALAIALNEIMLSCLAFIPAPIVYGLILDTSCLFWEEHCGRKGNCLVYNDKKIRLYSNFTSSGLLCMAAIFDFGVFRNVKKLNIYDDEIRDHDASEKLNRNRENLLDEN